MSEDEIFVLLVAIGSMGFTSVNGLHALCLERNPGPGLVRLSVIASLAWLGIVLMALPMAGICTVEMSPMTFAMDYLPAATSLALKSCTDIPVCWVPMS